MKVISIYGPIGYIGMEPPDIRKLLDEANGEDIRVEINSPGGFVWDGLEIYHLFKNYSGNVHMHIMALCASMASFIALAGDKITSESATVWMIHNPIGGIFGANYIEAEKFASYMKSMALMMAKVYVEKTGKTLREIRKAMDDETYLFGQEIKDFGLVDEIIPIDDNDNNDIDARNVAMACAKLSIDECETKIKASDKKEDVEKLAAFFETEIEEGSVLSEMAIKALKESNNKTIHVITEPENKPAGAGKNKTEVKNMTLAEFLAANPVEKIEFDKMITAEFQKGVEAGEKNISARVEMASKYLKGEYPDQIKKIAAEAIIGDKSAETLEAVVAVHDMAEEKIKAAAAELEKQKQTPTQQPSAMTQDGIAKTPEDIAAMAAADKTGGV
jgi:ATP-dependent Clp endopeptidase proteolytic subunit ClpP